MRIFVTGVTGFVGSHIAETLLRAGHEVVGLVRDEAGLDRDLLPWLSRETGRAPSLDTDASAGGRDPSGNGPSSALGLDSGQARPAAGNLRLVRGSLGDAGALREAAAGAGAVVHVAGLIRARNEAEFMRVNRDGTEAVLDAVSLAAPGLCRFVLVSSQAAGGPSRDGRPVRADDPPHPVSAYGRSKRAAEEKSLARAGVVPVTILRPSVVFGPRDRALLSFFRAVGRGTTIVWGKGGNRFHTVFAPDLARAALLAIEREHPSGAILYVADDAPLSWLTFTRALEKSIGRKARVLCVPAFVFSTAAAATTMVSLFTGGHAALPFDKLKDLREPAWLCSNEETRRILGWSPAVPLEDSLAATHAWYRTRGLM